METHQPKELPILQEVTANVTGELETSTHRSGWTQLHGGLGGAAGLNGCVHDATAVSSAVGKTGCWKAQCQLRRPQDCTLIRGGCWDILAECPDS